MSRLFFILLFSILFFSCSNSRESKAVSATDSVIHEANSIRSNEDSVAKAIPAKATLINNKDLKETAVNIFKLISNRKYDLLKGYCDSSGVRFSQYGILQKKDIVLNIAKEGIDTSKIYLWGFYNGSGNEIKENFNAYAKHFICKKDFLAITNSEISSNEKGTAEFPTLKNNPVVTFKYNGSEANGNMDWCSVSFFFKKKNDSYFLIAVIQNQWKI